MQQFYYAQLNTDGVCICMSQLTDEVDNPNMIRLSVDEYNSDLLGCSYKNGKWDSKPKVKPSDLSENDILSLAVADLYGEIKNLSADQNAIMLALTEIYERGVING